MGVGPLAVRCPDCGTELGSDAGTEGLCPRCLLSLALLDPEVDPAAGSVLDREAPTLDHPAAGPLPAGPPPEQESEGPTPGRILGERYQMRELLGRGGMGEVWRAFDLKLRVDVALKSVRAERLPGERGQEVLRQEVRAAREVVSPNVCRVFDLIVEEGRELVSMESIDGTTLAETLQQRGPLELQEAREIASQFLAGLQAIHEAGLVHRDFKPENVMITRAGRVVVMDFGLAKGLTEHERGTVAGTPAYMSPEQARGSALDARGDVYAAGVVLAEMLSVGGEGGLESRRALWEAVRETPPRVPEGPWAEVLRHTLAPHPEDRPASARALARALEEVTLRLPGFEDERPYPGLSSFTEDDAEYFFGREAEVEEVWKKLRRPRLLALIGPSGTGKSSFVRAGLLPALPESWSAVVATPGHRPFASLARALVPAFAKDSEATAAFADAALRFEEPDMAVEVVTQWRRRHEHALIVVDQFEELFTLNQPEVQQAFAELLGRLVLEADVHVLLSLRDDFLFQCTSQEALAPAFADLTPLRSLSESGLRRALVQPALACGYRFEDESLIDKMVQEVGEERGALPLLAFAASRLWEKRDRERGLLTREAYEGIGGVGGALAQHAEATLERIGTHRTPLVRELFRNLVTAQGTRAVREREELLSVFASVDEGTQKEASEVLDALVDARLLVTYEEAGAEGREGTARHRIEIVHESLLKAWPRLVRWQAQDEEGALLRDQLTQAARLWEEKDRAPDLLWSGTAFREYELWRERYPGKLTALEDEFSRSMAERARRRRRLRRLLVASVILGLSVVAAAMSVSRHQEAAARQRAEDEARRAEASELRALGTLQLETDPSVALAYAIASLERFDDGAARRFALESLAAGPTAVFADVEPTRPRTRPSFSPNGEWLSAAGCLGARLLPRDGGAATVLDDGGFGKPTACGRSVKFAADGDHLAYRPPDWRFVQIWSISKNEEVKRFEWEGGTSFFFFGNRLVMVTRPESEAEPRLVREYDLESEELKILERWDAHGVRGLSFDRDGRWLAFVRVDDDRVFLRPFWGQTPIVERVIGRLAAPTRNVEMSPAGDRVAAVDEAGEIRIWSLDARTKVPLRTLRVEGQVRGFGLAPSGTWLGVGYASDKSSDTLVRVWDLEGPEGAAPIALRSRNVQPFPVFAFDPTSRLAAVAYSESVGFFPLERRVHVLPGEGNIGSKVGFTPDSRSLVAGFIFGPVRTWPLDGGRPRDLWEAPGQLNDFAVDPEGRHLVAVTLGGAALVGLGDGTRRELPDTPDRGGLVEVAISADGRFAAAGRNYPPEQAGIRVWNLESLEVRVLEDSRGRAVWGLAFAPDGTLFSSDEAGVVSRWDLRADRRTTVAGTGQPATLALSPNGRYLLVIAGPVGGKFDADVVPRSMLYDLDAATSRPFTSHGDLAAATFDPTSRWIVTGDRQGVVRVGPVTGETPHFLLGHGTSINSVAVSPDGRWIASSEARESTVRLWLRPEGPPLQTLPYDDLLARLRARTNLRVVRDTTSPSGYRVETGPFPGWAALVEP